MFAHAITTDAWRNSLDHYQEFVIIVALDLKIEDEKLIGTIYFLNLDDRNKSAELSYVLNKKFEGHGYATEAAIKLRDIFFNELEGERLYARHTFDNLKSMNLMARIGMKIEGTLRKSYCFHGRQVDLAIWSMTRDDL
ncbi:GNAT family N-acetyltransferase [Lactobacillus rhamnosus]|uniref:GNAT family N-acetyltransferase n=2 Tax=Lacticaseibacillus rhamnosus TaxID=47715 RepID=A0A853J284_LACRH|nr:GNAT family N-acetyltransferase [Lacticaseibacillus rhamnosus]NZA30049.1 GNAT family N-acetyltransferase [Lacticaseibacillus rhamnosus]